MKKIYVNAKNIKLRFSFRKSMKQIFEYWNKFVYENKLNIFGSDGQIVIQKRILETELYKNNYTLWG